MLFPYIMSPLYDDGMSFVIFVVTKNINSATRGGGLLALPSSVLHLELEMSQFV